MCLHGPFLVWSFSSCLLFFFFFNMYVHASVPLPSTFLSKIKGIDLLFNNSFVPQNLIYLLFLLSVSLLLPPVFPLPISVTEGSNTWIEFKQELGWFFSYPLVMIGLISTNTSHNNLCLLGDPRDVNDYANNSGYKFSFRRRGEKERGESASSV